MKKAAKKKIPQFKNEKKEREFWQTHDSTSHLDWSKARRTRFPNLRPSTKVISLRLPEDLLNDIKKLALEKDVPYQSLTKILLHERVQEEKRVSRRSSSLDEETFTRALQQFMKEHNDVLQTLARK